MFHIQQEQEEVDVCDVCLSQVKHTFSLSLCQLTYIQYDT
jgi:hypothetical protein